MNEVSSYIEKVKSYWKSEYPDKTLPKEINSLIINCHYLKWTVPKCCSRIHEMHFAKIKDKN